MNVRRLSIALALAALGCTTVARAAQTRAFVADASDLMNGVADSVAVTTRGRMFLAPRLTRMGPPGPALGAAHAWAVSADSRANLYVGTDSDGQVLRLQPGGGASVFFAAPEPFVSALHFVTGGDLLVATAPGGKIYRVRPDGSGRVWCETGEQYVWALTQSPDGTLYAATGERGVLLRIDRNGQSDPIFDSDEPHLTAVVAQNDGTLLAGSAGRGLVFQIRRDAPASVLFDGDLAEVADLALEADGAVVAGFLSAPDAEPRPPAVRIQVPQGAGRAGAEGVGGLDERAAPALEGIIEGLPTSAEGRASRRARGVVVRIQPSGLAEELWRSSAESVLAVGIDANRRVVFGTGEPARLYRIADATEVERIATLPEAQVTALTRSGSELVVATSNPAAAYRLENASAAQGTFVSEPVDADAPARWGTLQFRTSHGAPNAGLQVQLRTGNSARPDATWSEWTKPATVPNAPLSVPDGRYLQWRARFLGSTDAEAKLEDISLSYSPYNRPPVVESFRLDTSKASFSDKIPFRWTAMDPDGDPVAVEIQYRSSATAPWEVALRVDPPLGADATSSEISDTDGKGSWESAQLAEGEYEIRAVASDFASNRAGEGTEGASRHTLRVTLDRTPPTLLVRRMAGGRVEVEGEDSLSPVLCLEVTEDGRAVHTVAAADGVCDGRREVFELRPEDAGSGATRSLRLGDAAGNSTSAGLPER